MAVLKSRLKHFIHIYCRSLNAPLQELPDFVPTVLSGAVLALRAFLPLKRTAAVSPSPSVFGTIRTSC